MWSALVLAQGAPRWGSGRARSEAKDILSEQRFRGVDPPRPLQGVFEEIGRWVRNIFENVADVFPGREAGLWTFLGLCVAAGAFLVAFTLAKRRMRSRAESEPDLVGSLVDDPRRLEREADDAERRGQLDRALRLRFRAGLVRLGRMGAIEWHPSLTSSEVSRRLRKGLFDNLARMFDEIVYGRRSPTQSDVEQSRADWSRLLGEVGR
jgi:hypothetical protein